jgi:hypothetical protein
MFLVRLVYVSEIVRPLNDIDIEQILESARVNNAKQGVTGVLCFHRKYFLQCLEGARSEVNKVYQKILLDKRHNNILLLNYQEITQREFETWTMGYVPESSLTKSLNMRFSGTGEFSPYDMLGESCHQMMVQLKNEIPFV